MNKYLAIKLSGPVVQGVADGFLDAASSWDALVAYWRDMTIENAKDNGDLDFLGALVGFPRPLVTIIFFETNLMALADEATPVSDPTRGFGDANVHPITGGGFDSALPLSTYKMPEMWYRQLLAIMAQVKRFGLTLKTIDLLAEWGNVVGLGTGYTISFNQYGNVSVVYATSIDLRALWIVNAVFAKMETIPIVTAQGP